MKSSMLLYKYVYKFLATAFLIPILLGCGEDDANMTPPPNPTPKPTISDIDPTSGPKGAVVAITGTNFGDEISNATVFFNGHEAVIETITSTQIKAVVPPGAGTGLIKVTIDQSEVVGPEFTYLPTAEVGTLAGGDFGFADGTGSNAQFGFPVGVAIDAAGNVYVAERSNHKIRKITPDGVTTTLAGSVRGFANGPGDVAQFDHPFGIAVDASGNVYVAEQINERIRKITPDGMVSTFAGGTRGFADGVGSNAQFDSPSGLAIDASGNLYVADADNHRIRKITPDATVSTLAGSTQGYTDGPGATAQFLIPIGVAVDGSGNVYVAERGGHKIRKVTPSGVVSTLAGSIQGMDDGPAANALFNIPLGVASDVAGNVYVADWKNHRIRKISSQGIVSTLAGSSIGFADGPGGTARFYEPIALVVDDTGIVYVADNRNHKIRKIIPE